MTLILDTNIWFLATAENLEESGIDREAVKKHGDADKVRGAIFQALMVGEVIVPKRVAAELEALKCSGKAAKHNRDNLDRLLYIFRNRAMEIIPSRHDITRQSAIIDALGAEKETSQAFHTYQKLSEKTKSKVGTAAEQSQASLDAQDPEANWERLARELDALKAQRETTRDTKALNSKIKDKRSKLDCELPFLIADYEILLCAERTNSQIFTLDNDLQAYWGISKSLKKTPEPRLALLRSKMEKTFNQLEAKIREKTKDMGTGMSFS